MKMINPCMKKSGEKIYCWDDEKGKTHYSNLGFPNNGKFYPKWVKVF